MSIHIPVLTEELKTLLALAPGDSAIDATLDGGGHARMMSALIGDGGKILGIEQDKAILKHLNAPGNLTVAIGNFRNIKKLAEKNNFTKVKAVLFDLGMSMWHIKESGRGFSFQKLEEPLLMNLGDTFLNKTAAQILNSETQTNLARILKNYGELNGPFARRAAKSIVKTRKQKRISSVGDLLKAIQTKDRKKLAQIFQALRIAVNDELMALEEGLSGAFETLMNKGRIAVISYHSLEDRIVKNNFKTFAMSGSARIITKKPVIPSAKEVNLNPSSRSAKLRVLEKI